MSDGGKLLYFKPTTHRKLLVRFCCKLNVYFFFQFGLISKCYESTLQARLNPLTLILACEWLPRHAVLAANNGRITACSSLSFISRAASANPPGRELPYEKNGVVYFSFQGLKTWLRHFQGCSSSDPQREL